MIPIYQKADDPDLTGRNVEMFTACEEAFDRGRLIAMYPEGATHSEARLRRIKTGAARIALGYEAHAPGRLTVAPVGLSFEARRRFRGRVLVLVGEAVDVSSHLAGYRGGPTEALHALTTAIQAAMAREVVDVGRIDMATLARAVEALYRGAVERELWGELKIAGRPIGSFPTSASIAEWPCTSARGTPDGSSDSGSGFSGTRPVSPPTGPVTRRCEVASSGRRSRGGWPDRGRGSWRGRSSCTGRR